MNISTIADRIVAWGSVIGIVFLIGFDIGAYVTAPPPSRTCVAKLSDGRELWIVHLDEEGKPKLCVYNPPKGKKT